MSAGNDASVNLASEAARYAALRDATGLEPSLACTLCDWYTFPLLPDDAAALGIEVTEAEGVGIGRVIAIVHIALRHPASIGVGNVEGSSGEDRLGSGSRDVRVRPKARTVRSTPERR